MARSKQYKSSRPERMRHVSDDLSAGPLGISDYLKLNLTFDVFCIVQLIIVRILLRDFAGLYFFFGFIMCAFLIASVFDYLSGKLDIGNHVEENV